MNFGVDVLGTGGYVAFVKPSGAGSMSVGVAQVGQEKPMVSDTLRLKATDGNKVTVRVYVDAFFVEVYFNDRVALTVPTTALSKEKAGVRILAPSDFPQPKVQAWTLDRIWTTPEDVIARAEAKSQSETTIIA